MNAFLIFTYNFIDHGGYNVNSNCKVGFLKRISLVERFDIFHITKEELSDNILLQEFQARENICNVSKSNSNTSLLKSCDTQRVSAKCPHSLVHVDNDVSLTGNNVK